LTLQRYIKLYISPNILAENIKKYIFLWFWVGFRGEKHEKTATIIADGGGSTNN